MPAPKDAINLLPPSEFEESIWGRLLHWAVSTGRYIIILTELVVIIAFLSRFKLDNDIANLSRDIESKKGLLMAYRSKEEEFLKTQAQLAKAQQLINTQIKIKETAGQILNSTPDSIKYAQLDIGSKQITVMTSAPDNTAISQMTATLLKNNNWKSVSMADTSFDTTKGITWTIKLDR